MDFRLTFSDNSLSARLGQDDNSSTAKIDFLVDHQLLQDKIVENEIDTSAVASGPNRP